MSQEDYMYVEPSGDDFVNAVQALSTGEMEIYIEHAVIVEGHYELIITGKSRARPTYISMGHYPTYIAACEKALELSKLAAMTACITP